MLESDQPKFSTPEAHASKKRKVAERVVVTVKMEGNDKKQQRSEGPPSDCWSWRKYGQKPIKGSPYPRGYYRCSTSKGCLAKKQVERCKTDASMLMITYTSTHNHPDPSDLAASPTNQKQLEQNEINPIPDITDSAQPTTPKQEQEAEMMAPATNGEDHSFQYSQSPFNSTPDHIVVGNEEDNNLFQENAVLYNDDPKPCCNGPMDLSSLLLKSEENDFYDELEELPTSSFFTAFMRSSFREERSTIVNPS